ncbi:MAG: peptidoglycan-binding domain-containing protein [Candidatus Omnitrophica bacterium]|nr:peptidoglycan-binding domain-containing protein [Candidatus Omnitrophota bacterium]
MKKYAVIIFIIFLGIHMFGCSKKETIPEISQESLSMEELSKQATQPVQPVEAQAIQSVPVTEPNLGSLPPPGPYKPTAQEIQTALKNAGSYAGAIDGKVGPLTKKAIEEFQKANNLQTDGKVGPKTWAALSPYLNPQPAPVTPEKKQ